ncbi:zinc finger RNA-binding protein-like isoform X2 [Littorina saxatilis]|uniref:zinc finger RNA-binding protein-like isoform X2 n=1 Tax=Littorina saxatilis TaxID=31220 RepID=UPI0038B5FA5E
MAHFVDPVPANAQPGTAYSAQPANVAATPAQAAYGTATPRPGQAYESYPAAHATTQYAYTTRTQVDVTPAVSYDDDQPKAYYQPAPAATAYTAAEAHCQTAKPVFTTGAAGFMAQSERQALQPKAPAVQVTTASQSCACSAASTPAVNTCTSAYNNPTSTQSSISDIVPGYDAAVCSAASSYYQQQQAAKAIGTWATDKPGTQPFEAKPKDPPKTPQLHYCDVCKISCAGPQTYREHLEGQKHKKKEAAMKGAATPVVRGGHNQLRCELCDVTCTGADAYAAHIRGAKHQKVVKLHTKLGKPIPSTDPVLVTTTGNSTVSVPKATSSTISAVGAGNKTVAKSTTTSSVNIVKKVAATPKITFVGGTTLGTTGAKTEEVKAAPAPEPAAAAEPMQTSSDDLKDDEHLNILGEKDVAPVGHEYIEEVRNEQGKTFGFNCKLCECNFIDPNAKEMHLKGRRHRLQYKKKVDPNLQVEMKPSIRARKIHEDKLRRQAQRAEFWRRRTQDFCFDKRKKFDY